MITYTLWKTKPNQNTYISTTKNTPATITNQEDLDKFWKEHPISIPSYWKWKSITKADELHHVILIIGKVNNFKSLTYGYNNCGNTVLCINASQYTQLAPRWDTLDNFTQLTEQEFESLVVKNNDIISNKIKQWQEQYSSAIALASATPV